MSFGNRHGSISASGCPFLAFTRSDVICTRSREVSGVPGSFFTFALPRICASTSGSAIETSSPVGHTRGAFATAEGAALGAALTTGCATAPASGAVFASSSALRLSSSHARRERSPVRRMARFIAREDSPQIGWKCAIEAAP